MITFRQHLSGLFIAGLYYSLMDDDLGASICFDTAVSILNTNALTVGWSNERQTYQG
jgi:hypothetical protein